MNKQKVEKLRGVVGLDLAQQRFSLDRFYPSAHLEPFIEHYWLISWNLPKGTSHTQQVVSHPCINISFLQNNSSVSGVNTKQFEHTLCDSGNLVGIRFTPAGFYPFANQAGIEMPNLTNQILPINEFFKIELQAFETKLLNLKKASQKTQKIEQELLTAPQTLDPNIPKINKIVKQIETDKSILKVSDICQKFSLDERRLQRLFNKYIGISPKWIINRYRIHEALEQIESTQNINWPDLALSLGYYDQAHFIKDFKNLVGTAPDSYLKNLK